MFFAIQPDPVILTFFMNVTRPQEESSLGAIAGMPNVRRRTGGIVIESSEKLVAVSSRLNDLGKSSASETENQHRGKQDSFHSSPFQTAGTADRAGSHGTGEPQIKVYKQ